MHRMATALAVVIAALVATTSPAQSHLVRPVQKHATRTHHYLVAKKNYAHVLYVCIQGTGKVQKKHCRAVPWLKREMRYWSLLPSANMTGWQATYNCEHGSGGWASNTGNGYYGGLQFDHWTWQRFGGTQYAENAHLATPEQQVIVASRVTYDAWPNCPNP